VLSKEPRFNSRSFTRRERKILKLIAEGYKDEEIADELCTNEKTVKEKQTHLMRKLNVHSRSSAIDSALGNGLITLYEILESRFSKMKPEAN
jgi:two-component system response regulator NreC